MDYSKRGWGILGFIIFVIGIFNVILGTPQHYKLIILGFFILILSILKMKRPVFFTLIAVTMLTRGLSYISSGCLLLYTVFVFPGNWATQIIAVQFSVEVAVSILLGGLFTRFAWGLWKFQDRARIWAMWLFFISTISNWIHFFTGFLSTAPVWLLIADTAIAFITWIYLHSDRVLELFTENVKMESVHETDL